MQQRGVILDGNVKRVLARFHAIEGHYSGAAVSKVLWQRADEHTPTRRVADYTQAIMDLGATLCVAQQTRLRRLSTEKTLPSTQRTESQRTTH